MKRLILTLTFLLVLPPLYGVGWAEPPYVSVYHWTYEPDSSNLFLSTNAIEGPGYVLGHEEWYWEVFQEAEAGRTVLDSVQFTLWGLRYNSLFTTETWDSLASVPYKSDTAGAAFPMHAALLAADSVWIYERVRVQARWIDGDSSFTADGNTAPKYISRLVAKRQ